MPVKLINMGESGSGKTGALASLCAAGYNVRVLDLENGIEALVNLLIGKTSKYPKDSIKRLRWKTLTEPMRVLNGAIIPRAATVWPNAVGMLESWSGDSIYDPELAARQYAERKAKNPEAEMSDDERRGYAKAPDKLGTIYNWGKMDVLCTDTLTALGDSANNHIMQMSGKLGGAQTSMESMRNIGSAQGLLDKYLQFMRDSTLKCNVIINTHVNWCKEDGSNPEVGYTGTLYAFPTAIGKAMNLKIGRHFNHMVMTKRVGVSSRIYTRGLANAALKSGTPLQVNSDYAIEDGLSRYFADVLKDPAA